ncbi:hypothetical protein C8Q77DRAFT_1159879 [Trametes polyzona]|nr:hypothetical protein C8Q77DRAFT_1159879 [Trametes polyzona]
MPLFGKHNKNSGRHAAKHDARHDADLNANQNMGQPGSGVGAGAGYPDQAGYHNSGTKTGTGMPVGASADPYAAHNTNTNAPTTAAGMGAGANPTVPPASHINADNTRTGGGGGAGSRLAGKAERAAGTLVGSQALKERGFQKEQEAGAFKMQSAEIAEAERLEKEALMRRERAVAHGAHPDNRHLGGLQNANTLSDVTGGQAGQPTMGAAGGPGY